MTGHSKDAINVQLGPMIYWGHSLKCLFPGEWLIQRHELKSHPSMGMTHGSGASEFAAQLPSSCIAVLYCVLSYSWCTLSALLTAYREEAILWICYVSGTSWDQVNCLISWVFRSFSIEWNVSLQRWFLQSWPSICIVSQGEVRQFSLRTVLSIMVQYCTMWMGNVYCCNSRSVKWIETFECLLWIINRTRNLLFLRQNFSTKFSSISKLWSYCLSLHAQECATIHSPRMRNLLLFLTRAIVDEDVGWNPICSITNSLLADIYAQMFTSFVLSGKLILFSDTAWQVNGDDNSVSCKYGERCMILHLTQGGVVKEVTEPFIPRSLF